MISSSYSLSLNVGRRDDLVADADPVADVVADVVAAAAADSAAAVGV